MNKQELLSYLKDLMISADHVYITYDILKNLDFMGLRQNEILDELVKGLVAKKEFETSEFMSDYLEYEDALFLIKYMIYKNEVKYSKIGDKLITSTVFNSLKDGNKNDLIKSRIALKLMSMVSCTQSRLAINLLSRDIFMASAYYTEKIHKTEDEVVKDNVSANKYNVSFCFENIEDELSKTNFVLDDNLILNNEFYAGIYGIDEKLYNGVRKNYIKDLVSLAIDSIYSYSDTEYKYRTQNANLEVIFSILKGSLLLSTEKEIELMRERLIPSEENASKLLLHARSNVNSIFDEAYKEKEKCYKLTYLNKKYIN